MACLAASAFLAGSTRAVAQSNEAHADELFRQGQALLQSGRLPEACGRLEDSLRLDAALGTLLNLALCREREGRVATAYRAYGVAAMWASQRGERDREQFAKRRLSELEARLSKIRIEIAGGGRSNLQVKLDGTLLETAQLEGDIPVDPGTHRLELTGEGRQTWNRRDLWIETPGLTVVRLALDAVPAGPERAAAPVARPPGQPTLGYVLGGAGIASLGVGVALLLRAAALDRESEREAERARMATPPDPAGRATALERYDTALVNQNLGLAAAGVGVLGVGASLYLLLSARPSESATPPRALRIVPGVAPSTAGLQIQGRF
jgi:hypothetical protein